MLAHGRLSLDNRRAERGGETNGRPNAYRRNKCRGQQALGCRKTCVTLASGSESIAESGAVPFYEAGQD